MTATRAGSVIVGVDTHKHVHVAVALNGHGERLGDAMIAAERAGYEQLLTWARAFGRVERFGIEGSGSYGQGLVSFLRRHDQPVLEAGRPDRRDRRQRGKSDTLDAENAARAVLAGTANATPRRAEATSEMLRQVKVARDTAVKAAKDSIRALARRWQLFDGEIAEHDEIVEQLTLEAAPRMRQAFGIGPDTTAEMLILAGDRPHERLGSEAAFAKLCGAAPIPASSGMTQRHRLNPAGHRQANSALYRTVFVRMRFHPATIAYVARRTAEGKSKREIIRCLKRYLAREIYHYLTDTPSPAAAPG